MKFNKYNSIENAYQEDFLQSIREQGFGHLEYTVQEKVHGANLSFITDGKNIVCAKRTAILLDTEEFFNSKFVKAKYEDKLLQLFEEVNRLYKTQTLSIFGELFGGGYPHAEVPPVADAKLVQRGIYYCPENDFYAFDILLDNGTYLDLDTVNALFEKMGFLYAQTLFRGSLADCLAYPNEFKTTLPDRFKLPELPGNFCEGVVIRPIKPQFLGGGSRVLIKNKNEKWAENNSHIDKEILSKLLHEGEELSEQARFLCEEIYKLINVNRLQNLISKIGEINPKKDLGKVLGLYNKDVLGDFFKTYQSAYDSLEKHESKAITKFLNKHAGELIGEHFEH